MSKNAISNSVIRRLPRYYRFLGDLEANGYVRISSRELAEKMGLTASQIRQDFNCFGEFGQQGYGYNVTGLRGEIGKILGLDKQTPMILLGAGNLGRALASHIDFHNRGFDLVGIFDANPELVGKKSATLLLWTLLNWRTSAVSISRLRLYSVFRESLQKRKLKSSSATECVHSGISLITTCA